MYAIPNTGHTPPYLATCGGGLTSVGIWHPIQERAVFRSRGREIINIAAQPTI